MDIVFENTKYLERFLPYSLPVLGRLLCGDYIRTMTLGNKGVAVLCLYDELILFLYNIDDIGEILTKINNEFGKVRIILYTNQRIDIKIILKDYMITEENFLLSGLQKSINNNKSFLNIGRFARNDDIPELIKLEESYIDEEIVWRKEERKTNLVTKYRDKIKRNHVFINGEPVKCKIEVKSQYNQYIEVGGICTEASKRQKGIATQCLQKFLEWAVSEQLEVVLNTRNDNIRANKLYNSTNFSKIGIVYYMICRR